MNLTGLKRIQADSDAANSQLRERVDTLLRENSDLQNYASSTALSVDRLTDALTKAETEETRLKEKIQALSLSLADSNSSSQNLQDRIQQLQRSLDSTDGEKRLQQERANTIKENLKETKHENRVLSEKLELLQQTEAASDLRLRDFESQVKHVKILLQEREEREKRFLERVRTLEEEKDSLREQNISLQRLNSSYESEQRELQRSNVRVSKDVLALKKTMEKLQRERLEFEESYFETSQEKEILGRTLNEAVQENKGLREHVDTLKKMLTDAEDTHAKRYRKWKAPTNPKGAVSVYKSTCNNSFAGRITGASASAQIKLHFF